MVFSPRRPSNNSLFARRAPPCLVVQNEQNGQNLGDCARERERGRVSEDSATRGACSMGDRNNVCLSLSPALSLPFSLSLSLSLCLSVCLPLTHTLSLSHTHTHAHTHTHTHTHTDLRGFSAPEVRGGTQPPLATPLRQGLPNVHVRSFSDET